MQEMPPPVEQILADLIRLRTENPPGGETAVAGYFKALFDRFGIESQVVEPKPGRGSFVASAGSGGRSLLYLSHIDVVPVGEGWDFDPFCGEVRGGMVLGRGALDCKGLAAAEAYAFLYLANAGTLKGKLIFAATADEEMGGDLGVRFLMEQHPELLRADFAINEGGEPPLPLGGETVYFLQVGEKGTAWGQLRSQGVSCHGSLPHLGDNAVVKMARAVVGLGAYQPRITLIPEVRQLITELARLQGVKGEVREETVDQVIDHFPLKPFAAYLKAITRMTISPNALHGGTKTNIVPDSAQAEVDIRILPGQDQEFVVGEVKRIVGPEIEFRIPNFNPPTFSPTQTAHYRLVTETVREVSGARTCLPCLSSGATDSRFLRRAGMPAYGIGMLAPGFDQDLRQTVHGRNERIDIVSLRLKAQFLIKLAQKYLA